MPLAFGEILQLSERRACEAYLASGFSEGAAVLSCIAVRMADCRVGIIGLVEECSCCGERSREGLRAVEVSADSRKRQERPLEKDGAPADEVSCSLG